MQFVPVFLLLALSMSWARFIVIFHPGTDHTLAQSPLTLAATSVGISSIGLAIADQGTVTGSLLILTAILASRVLRSGASPVAVITSCASLCAYLQFDGRVW